jgi:hypothetical protein
MKCGEEAHQALDGEVVEASTVDQRHFRLIDAEELRSLRLAELAFLQDLDDPGGELRLCEEFVGVRQAEILEDVAAPNSGVEFGDTRSLTWPMGPVAALRSRTMALAIRSTTLDLLGGAQPVGGAVQNARSVLVDMRRKSASVGNPALEKGVRSAQGRSSNRACHTSGSSAVTDPWCATL